MVLSANLVFHTTDILANSEAAIEIPISECTVIQSLKCGLCDYECDSEVLLEQHKQAYHQTVMTIVTNPDSDVHTQTGNIIFETNDILKNFEAVVEGLAPERIRTQPFKCDLCDIVCDSALILEQHRQIYHQTIVPNSDNDMHTDFENLIFQTNDNLVNSESAVEGPPPECTGIQSFRCDLCDYECDSEVLLEQHKQMYHQTFEIIHINPDRTSYLVI
ncbi:zinc finger protein [Trichonephila inaurata madagascariensis]|uniref:Zinc finger protein n=1 Tax=Trichonephila inaurata madagascariensis TaxID=2747483 RepID=A0A8X6JM57_9ARAC|nr:zinc finger protein [Trichonephila inaurata madagascariensis]